MEATQVSIDRRMARQNVGDIYIYIYKHRIEENLYIIYNRILFNTKRKKILRQATI